ncbi:ATP-dependent DNA helicase RecG [Candidatus Uhrbacteria bacterium]|nr:ATP-dependent DNA helicase RecG [Candidatus Uhrbacteria bacterium]
MAVHLGTSVRDLSGVGPVFDKDFQRLGIVSVRDLVWHLPYRYEDFSQTKPIPRLRHDDTVTVVGTIVTLTNRRAKNGRMTLTEAVLENETGSVKIVWFNQAYLEQALPPGTKVAIAGRVNRKFGVTQFVNPVQEPPGRNIHTGRLVPIYGLSGSLTQRRVRGVIHAALAAASEIPDWLPLDIIEREAFPQLTHALTAIHAPDSAAHLEGAVRRLKFDELFLHQLLFAQVRRDRVVRPAYSVPIDVDGLRAFVASLPFPLTTAQRKAVWEAVQNLSEETPMNRLLQGDVGSGKTVVAAMLTQAVMQAGCQVVYLAPTEILAGQQHRAFSAFLPAREVALLTHGKAYVGDQSVKREELLSSLETGEACCVVGTHALLQEDVHFDRLALVVIDEQHRFGVEQRHALLTRAGDRVPHLFSMTATPIPRSLTLTLYGDLDVSVLNERPAGRQPIETHLVPPGGEGEMHTALKRELGVGHQAYVVCPLIDPSDQIGSQSVKEAAKRLSAGPLKGFKVGILHGQLKAQEKDAVIADFAAGALDVLVSTTVVEVGMDVPNATVMVILGADRFGLAQLHQLRGRVGRSDKASFCFLCPDSLTIAGRDRLEAVVACQDGFELAEKDLQIRGSGNIFGSAQSGFPDFRLATLSDTDLMKQARDWARWLMDKDPNLEQHPLVRERITQTFEDVHLE